MSSFRFDACELLPAKRQLRIDGESVLLGARAFDVLLALVERAGRLVTKTELLDIAWPGMVVEEANVQVQISALRKLLGPAAICTIPGSGYRFTATLLDTAAPQPSMTAAPLHNLPESRTLFIGRKSALARCGELLAQNRLLTLTGIGGCGKTRLGLQLAHEQAANFLAGVWFVDLAPVGDDSGVASALAAALDVREEHGTALVDRLTARLAAGSTLVVLDNCEHVVAAVQALCDTLLSRCAGVKVLATSRVVLHILGEQIFAVQPLSLPANEHAAELAESEAMQLFLNRAKLVCADFSATGAQAAAVGRICQRLDGIALAIELAAARASVLSVQEIDAGLVDRFRFLTGTSRTFPRHQTMEATLQWSYDSLPDRERRALRTLSVFAGGWTLSSTPIVCALEDGTTALEVLVSLNDKSLLVIDRRPPETRYRMLETVREFAQARLEESGEAMAARRRHLRWVVDLVEEAAPALQGPAQGEWMARLWREQENIFAAQARSLQQGFAGDEALTLAAALSRYWLSSAQVGRGYRFARDALAQATSNSHPLRHCRALNALGTAAFRMGRYHETLEAATQALTMARALGDASEIAAALGLRTKGLHASGQDRLALECAAESCEAARALGPSTRLSAALNNLGEIHRGLRQFFSARACYEEAIAITRRLGYAGGTFVSLCNLVRVSIASGHLDSAGTLLMEGVALWEVAGLKAMGKDLLECGAGLAASGGEARVAARLAGAARARLDEAGISREQVDEDFLEPLLARAREAVGSDAFDEAEAAGLATGYEAAMAEVRQWLQEYNGRPG